MNDIKIIVRDDNGNSVTPPRLLVGERLIMLRPDENGWVFDDPNDVAFVRDVLGVNEESG